MPPGIVPADGGRVVFDGGPAFDGGTSDDAGLDAGIDAGAESDAGIDAGPILAPYGAACSQDADCVSGLCVTSVAGSRCSALCSDGACPSPFDACRTIARDDGGTLVACVPFEATYCRECAASSDCPNEGDRCVDVGGATYCTLDCSTSGTCPTGYACRDVPATSTVEGRARPDGGSASTPDGGDGDGGSSNDGGDGDGGSSSDGAASGDGGALVYRQCLPVSGLCPGCIDRDGDGYGAGADCRGPDCNDDDITIHPGAVELCDGFDNNCDGRIDEGFDFQTDDANCGRCGITCDTASGQKCCGGRCVDTYTSASHCGGCGQACDAAGEACCFGVCKSTDTDPNHCGGCGQTCTNEHGDVHCASGRCAPSCGSGYGDCDLDPRNGCEQRLNVDAHCGACNAHCDNPNGTTGCNQSGVCAPVCAQGYGDCDGNPRNGCETDTRISPANCGACGSPCTNAGGTTACEAGACTPSCDPGFGDCDGNPRNGCETDLARTLAHCGSCNAPCTNEHGATTCQTGLCVPTCESGFADCDRSPRNGCETDTRTSLANCGGCNQICANAHGRTACVAGLCTPTCDPGFADCDGNPRNGCETELATSTQSCGTCGQICTNGHGTTSCASGRCAPACDPGWGDCDNNPQNGCETDTSTSIAHCGACGLACTNPHGTTSCQLGVCRPVCQAGFYDCDGDPRNGCEANITLVDVCNACRTDVECPDGFYCGGNVCVRKKVLGNDCAEARECQSAFCADRVCCQSDCSGTCRSCRLTGSRGQCRFIPSGQDPKNECDAEAPSTCGRDGYCDGQGGCRLLPSGTECVAQSCSGTTQQSARQCDGHGVCLTTSPATTPCAPYTCGTSGCLTACAIDAQCQAGYACVGGVCKVAGGLGCTRATDCASGYCVDGVCCNEPCNGLCERCDQAGAIGACTAIAAGQDPNEECATDPTSTCGQTGACSGVRGRCALYPAGTICSPPMCASGVESHTRSCDGAGTCLTPSPATAPCAPYVCNDTATACFTTCASDAQCLPGFACAAGACKRAQASACLADADCASGFCTDGVCCESRCAGRCEKCSQAGRAGFCDAIPAGQDPDEECATDAPATCGRTGLCDGRRACALYASGTVCAAAFCQGTVSVLADLCDGAGVCRDGGMQDCAPYTCNGVSGMCRTSCTSSLECIAGFDCAAGLCKRSLGAPCSADADCGSGFCTDGVCCEARCGGTCEKCNQTFREGFCDAIPAGQDPDSECATDLASTCGQTGVCSGSRTCALYASGTVCAPPVCQGGLSLRARSCDGRGACLDQGTQACLPYACDGNTGLCRVTCAADGDCQSGYACAGGACKKALGQACGTATECASGYCADGVCCNARCAGVCERCSLAGRVGYCDPIPAGTDPDNECAQDTASTCAQNGACSGRRTCQLYGAGTVCRAGSCVGSTSNPPDTCDGLGHCIDSGTSNCAPYTCDLTTGLCLITCSASLPCQAGFDCVGGFCKKSQGSVCASDVECGSGFCTDGVCCESRCGGTCEKCSLAGRAGFCDPVAAGQDPDAECEASAPSTCGQTGACSGARACALQPSGTICHAPACSGTITTLASTCDGHGACVFNGTADCSPYGCDALTGSCLSTCAGNADCVAGFQCAGGRCLLPGASSCTADAQCASGFCTDGVCCESRCGGTCEKCNLAGRAGFCDAIAAGLDPDNECPTDPASTCGRTGVCSGARTCALYPSGTECVAPFCASSTSNLGSACSGGGACVPRGTQICAPYVCDATSGRCASACSTSAQCQSGFTCSAGVCKKAQGTACTADAECGSGFCSDGVCCESRCAGTCEKCSQGARAGFCDPIPAGQDPDNECATDPVSSCGKTGQCSGLRACALYGAGTVCTPALCNGNVASAANTCDGLGVCVSGGSRDCSPYRCDSISGACRASCAIASDCVPGNDCVGGACKKVQGEACTADGQCASGFCTDLVCCEARCGGTCEKCNQTSRVGFCDPIPAGSDPDNECAADPASSCGKTGQCSGLRSCQLWAAGSVCVAAQCSGGASILASTCDGAGACVAHGTQGCSPYACDAASGGCRASCAADADCATGFACASGVCKKAKGAACLADGDCASGFCTDLVCCESRCGGLCEKCSQSGRAGFCDPIAAGQDPDGECAQDPVSGCGQTGQCSGQRTCQLYASGTVCRAAFCIGNTLSRADTCDGLGACVGGGQVSCSPFVCDTATSACKTSCSQPTDCPSGYGCVSGTCKKNQGVACGADAECASGFCTDQVCCESRCGGACEKCSQASRLGFCDAIPAGTDPDSECATDAISTCGKTGLCSGQRSCQLYASGTVCLAASCASAATSNRARACDGLGHCVDPGPQACAPYVCDAASGACKTACSVAGDCQSGFTCSGGVCKKAQGTSCGADAECASGFCTDLVCCDSRCGGTCEKCSQSGRLGFCDPIPAGQDPDNECAADPVSSCGQNGFCSGSRTCARFAAGTICNPAACVDGTTSRLADTCSSGGACQVNGTQSCAPFACLSTTGLCATTCASAADCQAGYDCGQGGLCKKAKGAACVSDGECASGFCTDQVCCESRCGGVCEKCSQSGRAGFCDPIAVDTDPDNECTAATVSSCGQTGNCSGQRSCKLYTSGTICAPASCSGGISQGARLCDGGGTCQASVPRDCSPFVCDAASGACKTSCATTADCQSGASCVGGLCKTAQGLACAADADCASGFCTDGVCCQSRCGGTCEKCSLPGRAGFCDPVPAGTDPDNECPTDPASTCMRTGLCDGARACGLYANGTVCAAPYCNVDVAVAAHTCDGLGACVARGSVPCSPYACNVATAACETSCATSADCDLGWECKAGACKKSQGGACVADADCASGFCTDQVCCASRCGGTCEKCNQAARAGFCDPVPAGTDPDNECAADPVSTCGHSGNCDGARACGLYPSGTGCTAAYCTGNTSTLANTCNGTGVCQANGARPCAPYVCDAASGNCKTSCASVADCTAGYQCLGGVCAKPQGAGCSVDGDCQSGFCTDGVCCESRCGGLCEKCNQSGRAGFCDPIPAGTDPDNECPTDAASTCGRNGFCSGQRACALYAATTVCLPAACNGQVSTLASTCDGVGHCSAGGSVTCDPYLCNGATGLCRTSCATNADCTGGSVCASGFCKSATGAVCAQDGDCQTGFCTDGVCCESRCGGICEKCNQAARAGFCDPVAAGTDPDNECTQAGVQTCGQTGLCSGLRSCGIYPSGTLCRAPSCKNGQSQSASYCNGTQQCIDGALVGCGSFGCDPATGLCRTACTVDADCQAGYGCFGGVCKKTNATSCLSDAECGSGYCTDGLCCESRCGGICEKCNAAGREGHCDAIAAGTDPDNDCAQDDPSTCRQTGVCDGNRACALYPAATQCAPATCSANQSRLPSQCDGRGSCVLGSSQACSPYACNATTGLCRSACLATSDCQTGYECASGTCKLSQGAACAKDLDCASGFCTDGVCCTARCGGVCEKCNQSGRAGFCDPIAAGTDPDNECSQDAASSCRQTGYCSGQRACALYASGTVCQAASCTAGIAILAAHCDGSGQCQTGGTQACSPYACDATATVCRTSCAASADCQAGFECSNGSCRTARGLSCASDAECASATCTDGVCCEARCSGLCESCNQVGRAGFCDPIPAGTDPDNECVADAVSTCGHTGYCSGARTCALFPAGTLCSAASCVGSTSQLSSTCNGTGTCVSNGLQTCTPYPCDAATGLCRTSCTTTADCTTGLECAAGACKKPRGAGCTVDAECSSGFCTDGYCCESRCGGTCEKCSFPSRLGFCDPVPAGQDPDDECPTDPVSSCARNGSCSGQRSCAKYAAGTRCVATACTSSTVASLGSLCDGNGTCAAAGTASCPPYACDATSGACRTTCTTIADCAPGFECSAGFCKKPRATACASDLECSSGFCTDGVCCESRCGGTCEKCNQSGRAGYCDAIPAGTDPDEECPTDLASTCGRTGLCSGARSCALYPAGTICVAGACVSSSTVDAPDRCDGQGACVINGVTTCSPYACDPALGGCRTSCTADSQCALGYRCKTSTGQCLKDDGQTCTTNSECVNGACCLGACTNPLTDVANCGACGTACANPNGTTSCQNGSCSPVCNPLYASCDGNAQNGCETSLATLSSCGACGVPCARNNAVATCATGTCGIRSCNLGYDNCDGVDANGCEQAHVPAPESCATAEDLGSICGDTACGFFCPGSNWRTLTSRADHRSRWFHMRANECSNCCADITARVTLNVPAGVDYDLYVYRGCGNLVGSSVNGVGATDQVTVTNADDCLNGDSGFDLWIEVRFFGGNSCSNWSLVVEGRDC